MVFGGTCDGRTIGGCEWIESVSELPSTYMVLSLCVRADSMPPVLFCIEVSLSKQMPGGSRTSSCGWSKGS